MTPYTPLHPDDVTILFLSYFFVKKISLSWRVEYVVDGSMDQ